MAKVLFCNGHCCGVVLLQKKGQISAEICPLFLWGYKFLANLHSMGCRGYKDCPCCALCVS